MAAVFPDNCYKCITPKMSGGKNHFKKLKIINIFLTLWTEHQPMESCFDKDIRNDEKESHVTSRNEDEVR